MSKNKVVQIPQRREVSSYSVEVRESAIHGRGVFATAYIAPGERIGVLTGVIPREIDFECPFSIWFTDQRGSAHVWVPDEPYRYLNHAEHPNAEICGVILYACEIIFPGDEITIYYGPGWDTAEDEVSKNISRKSKKTAARKKTTIRYVSRVVPTCHMV